tara:strand:+ start:260 stop:1024 length:765 start_codon:yes stop_codon:yes gene_type:complete
MTSFTIKHTKPDGSTDTYSSDNISTVSYEFSSPVAPMPLPQQADTENILIKVEGNTTTVNISWTVIDEPSGNAFTGSNAETPLEQVSHFKTSFVPVTIADVYDLTIGTGSEAMVFRGVITRMSFSVSGNAPVTWDGSLQFLHGNLQIQYDKDISKVPEMSAAGISNKSGTNGEVTLNGIHTDYLGSEAAITHYVVSYRQSGGTVWSTVEHATSNSSTQTIDVDLNVTGSYEVRVAAKTTENTGMFTTEVTVTIT